jgi:hypothetical protein
MTATSDDTRAGDDTRASDADLAQRTRTPIWLTVVLVVVVFALGAWIVYDAVTEPSPPADVAAAIDDFLAAYADQDEEAMREVATEDFTRFGDDWGPDPQNPDRVIKVQTISGDLEDVIGLGFNFDWDNEITGDSTTTGEGPWIVSQPEAWYMMDRVWEGMATYVVVDEGGVKKILSYKGDFVVSFSD